MPEHVLSQIGLAQIQMDKCLVALDHCADTLDDEDLLGGMWALRVLFFQQKLVVAVNAALALLRRFIPHSLSGG